MPIAIIAFRRFGPSSPAITIASTRPGRANIMSTRRISSESTLPPKKPERRPSETPRTKAMPTEIAPTCSETWAPWMIRAIVSRPSSSVPIGCAQLGSWRRVATSSSGSIVQMYGPKTAMKTLKPTMIAPVMPIGLRHLAKLLALRVGAYAHWPAPRSLGPSGARIGPSLLGMLIPVRSSGRGRRRGDRRPGWQR